jgi:hypothetical protein
MGTEQPGPLNWSNPSVTWTLGCQLQGFAWVSLAGQGASVVSLLAKRTGAAVLGCRVCSCLTVKPSETETRRHGLFLWPWTVWWPWENPLFLGCFFSANGSGDEYFLLGQNLVSLLNLLLGPPVYLLYACNPSYSEGWGRRIMSLRSQKTKQNEKTQKGWGAAQWQNTCLACARPWVPSPVLKKKKKSCFSKDPV